MSKGIAVYNIEKSRNNQEFLDGSFRTSEQLISAAVGIGTYKPGWRWSLHVGPLTNKPSKKHIGYVLSGNFVVCDASGLEKIVGPGEAFEVGPDHDAWVEGNEACIALDFSDLSGNGSDP